MSSFAVEKIRAAYPSLSRGEIDRRLRYSTFVDPLARLLYFEVPKAACSTIKNLLRASRTTAPIPIHPPVSRETHRAQFVHLRANVPLPSLLDLDPGQQRAALEGDDFLRLAVVRNPFTRLVSAWKNKVFLCEPGYEYVYRAIRGHDPEPRFETLIRFPEFVGWVAEAEDLTTCNAHWRLQSEHLFARAIAYDHIGRLEAVEETIALIRGRLGMGEDAPPRRENVSLPIPAAPIDDDLSQTISALYRLDFETFGYPEATPESLRRPVASDPRLIAAIEEIVERNLIIGSLWAVSDARLETRLRQRWRRLKARLRPR